jgi:calcium-dependent protein kinase
MKHLNHPHVINVIETFEDEKFINHVTELCTGGDLLEKIISSDGFNENIAAKYMY